MTGRQHASAGVFVGLSLVLLAWPLRLVPALMLGLASVAGALAPDLDHHGSLATRRLGLLSWMCRSALSNPFIWMTCGYALRGRIPVKKIPTGAFERLLGSQAMSTVFGETRSHIWAARCATGRGVMKKLVGHRALSHSVLGLVLGVVAWAGLVAFGAYVLMHSSLVVSAPMAVLLGTEPVWELSCYMVAGFAVGWVSHIILDMLTVRGVQLWLPWTVEHHYLLPARRRITSGD
jgi:membrane-bound metal-dependent hydrolase YbcI (DUF457 family)